MKVGRHWHRLLGEVVCWDVAQLLCSGRQGSEKQLSEQCLCSWEEAAAVLVLNSVTLSLSFVAEQTD